MDAGYPNYGGRGIEFRFPSVLSGCLWIQENLGLNRRMELDRINNDGHYEPGNLRYATKSMQMRNARTTKTTYSDEEWAKWESPYAYNTSMGFLRKRISRENIIRSAFEVVKNKAKCWAQIEQRLRERGHTTS
jgi:hypothetical protein